MADKDDTGPYTGPGAGDKLDTSSDLLEQQQAMEQARLLQRFRELRQWQLQQQEQLMYQQRSQLEMLKQEQKKVQTMLNKERELQWGSGKVIRQQGGISPTKTPPKRRPPLPANNELVTALMSLVGGSQDPLAVTMDQSVAKSQASFLPMPVMYGPPDPALEDTSTNPDLFSSPGSRRNYQTDVDNVDDGVCPIQDTASEISDNSYLPLSGKKGFIRTQPFLGDMASDTVSVRSDGSYVPPTHRNGTRLDSTQNTMSPNAASLLQTLLQTANAETLKQMLGLAQPETAVIPDQPRRVDLNENCSSLHREGREPVTQSDYDRQNIERMNREIPSHHLDQDTQPLRSQSESVRDAEYSERDFNQRHYNLQRLLPGHRGEGQQNGRQMGQSDDVIEEESIAEGDDDEQDITVEEQQDKRPLGIDDRPIKSGLEGRKTFEQLLEEQMRDEEEKLRQASTDSPSVKKKPFLRKGQGLSRYGPGRKKSPKQPGQSSSSEQVTESKSGQDVRQIHKGKPNKPTQKPKKQVPIQSSKSSRGQSASSQAKNSKKDLSPRQKSKPKHSPRQKSPPKHSTPTGTDSPPPPSTGSGVQDKEAEGTESERFGDDASFVSKIKRIEENKKVEEEELEVFELLEDFADNVSFCSNSSVVSRLLQQQRNKEENMTNIAGVKAVIDAKKAEKELMATKQEPKILKPVSVQNVVKINSSLIDGVDLDTSSDTITDSSSDTSSDEEENVVTPTRDRDGKSAVNVITSYDSFFDKSQEDGFIFVNKQKIDSDMFRSSDSEVRSSVPLSPTKSMTRKIVTKASRDDFISDSNDDDLLTLEDSESRFAKLKQNVFGHSNQNHSASVEKQVLVDEMFKDHQTGTVGIQHETESDSQEESDDSDTKMKQVVQDAVRVASPDFDDDEEWTVTAPQTQVAMLDKAESNEKSSTPPTSRLVARLFPNLKNPKQVKEAEKKEQDQQKLQAVSKTVVGDGVQSKILRDKLAELEKEIEKFRNENASLEKLRKDREELLSKLKQEICEFEKEKDEELRRLEEFRNQETKKLKHERKLFEQYQKTVRAMPDKREREEIDALKRQLSELQEEVKKKEGRWTSANNRLRQRLEIVDMENKELKEEIRLLEKRRLEMLQRDAQKKNGVQKTFPRSSTPTEDPGARVTSDSDTVVTNLTSLTHDSTLKSTIHHPVVNGVNHKPSHNAQVPVPRPPNAAANPRPHTNFLAPSSAPSHAHNVSGDAIPRGQPSGPAVPRSDSQSPDDASSTGAVVNIPRKQSAKFSSENPAIDKGDKEFEESQYPDGKVERTYSNGAREILFANGTRKEISSDGQSIVVSFFNGDIKQIFPDQRVVYFYADAQTTHTTYPDGLEILQFQNNQIEKHYPDGTKEITFPDQTIKYLFPNGSEESIFPDGTVIRVEKNGDKAMEFPNGQREVHTEAYKRREYPDGTVKTVYPDGRQETRYSTGRIRLKDKDGNVIVDRMC